MKTRALKTFLIFSMGINILLLVSLSWEGMFIPNEEEKKILGEVTQKVIATKEFEKLNSQEKVYSVKASVDRFKGGFIPYFVTVKTDKQSYTFSCTEPSCAKVEVESWGYSEYSEDKPILPLKDK